MQKTQVIILFLFVVSTIMCQQAPTPEISSFEQMKAGYPGSVEYNATSETVTFTSSGILFFGGRLEKTDNIWHIPTSVLKVLLNENVTVTGQFT